MSCVVVRLPDGLPLTGDALIGVNARGQASNRVRVGFGSIGGGTPDDSGAVPPPALFPLPVNEPDMTRLELQRRKPAREPGRVPYCKRRAVTHAHQVKQLLRHRRPRCIQRRPLVRPKK